MADRFFVGAYWGARAETSGQCAARLEACLTSLGNTHELLSRWYRKGSSRAAARQPIDTDVQSLDALLLAGRNRTDVGGEVIADLGFRVSAWNNNSLSASFSTKCGAAPTVEGIMNHFFLELPEVSDATTDLYDARSANRILASVIEFWQPDWATFASFTMRDHQKAEAGRPFAGWQTYLSQAPALSPPPGIRAEQTNGGGVLITAGTDPLHVTESDLSAAITYLGATLDAK
ncbi:immunity protein 52 of polymorphic toxin system [Krasilnikovia cinnamomea]|uniref:Immunity protein 52 of polymorphic toxin system n=1 Tax=Krasilnikovia cinnamomea TaxID=349313 RepID=A0A4Q7ZJY2_9ACTN|nr:Imm52 family immunity protein [Krasilnikovia cinnamomea]RZU51218.1 immunity protein 52 of polymorphic toxin system [Krasilnikovia cinnamomea]